METRKKKQPFIPHLKERVFRPKRINRKKLTIDARADWIKTEDALPIESVWIITANSSKGTVEAGVLIEGVFKQPDLNYKILEVTHWMPMPVAPK